MQKQMKSIIIENTPPEIIVEMINAARSADGDNFRLKHEDSTLGFETDGHLLYGYDVDAPDIDECDLFRFQGGRFTRVVKEHYGETGSVLAFMESMRALGVELELADYVDNDSLSIEEYKTEIKAYS